MACPLCCGSGGICGCTTCPPLLDAAEADGEVLACYVLDPRLKASSGPRRLQYLYDALRELRDGLDGRLLVTRGRPETRIPALAKADRRDAGARVGRLHAVRPPTRRRGTRRARRHPAGSVGIAVPGLARPGRQGRRHALQGVHAVLSTRGASTAGGHRRSPARSRRRWIDPADVKGGVDIPDLRRRTRPARGREGGTAAVEVVRRATISPTTPTTATGPTCPPPAGCRRT